MQLEKEWTEAASKAQPAKKTNKVFEVKVNNFTNERQTSAREEVPKISQTQKFQLKLPEKNEVSEAMFSFRNQEQQDPNRQSTSSVNALSQTLTKNLPLKVIQNLNKLVDTSLDRPDSSNRGQSA